uniref:ATP-dependent RNA helicase n=1 Tax=Philasterides dicentrarchi TaxID=282688 RepID=A0A481XV16_9CILI|nr:DExD/H box RNA helicase 44 [Philasterides dicentrarchi]
MNAQNLYLVQAPGGSGKTLAFIIPALIYVMKNYDGKPNHRHESKMDRGKKVLTWHYSPRVIIIGDTKVLIEQLYNQVIKCLPEGDDNWNQKITVTTLYSGETRLDKFGEILICTTQILNTLMNAKKDHIYVDKVGLLITDEAELLYEKIPEHLTPIIEAVAANKISSYIAASATLTNEFSKFSKETFFGKSSNKNAIESRLNLTLEGVTQYVVELNNYQRDQELQEVVDEIKKLLQYTYLEAKLQTQIMIFVDSIRTLDFINDELLKDIELTQGPSKIKFDVIHSRMCTKIVNGNKVTDAKEQNKRLKSTYNDFRDNKFQLLLCTDIMARGIDIENVGLVINVFSPRKNTNDNRSEIDPAIYMHRIARTGRYKSQGISLQFRRSEKSQFFEIKDSKLSDALIDKFPLLKDNKICELKMGSDYIKTVVEQANKAVAFNKLQKDK